MSLVYGGKSKRSTLLVKFPDSFSLSTNEKHSSKTLESLKLLDEMVIPYIEKERENLQLTDAQPALLNIDVFSGQMTKPVIKKIRKNSPTEYDPAASTFGSDSKWGGKSVYET